MKAALIVLALLAVAVLAAAAGCAALARRSTEATKSLEAKIPGKAAVVCFSQSKVRNTGTVAAWIAKHAGADLIELEPAAPYPEPYGETLKAAERDFASGALPALKAIPSLDGYDIVFLGSPIWYGTYAPPLGTFLAADALAGKTVAPFCTHGGGGAGRFGADIRKACPEAMVLDPLALRGSNQIERRLGLGVAAHHTEDDVIDWLDRIFRARDHFAKSFR